MDDLNGVSRSDDAAVFRTYFQKSMNATLDTADKCGFRVGALLHGADEQNDQRPGLEALLEGVFHVMPTWRRCETTASGLDTRVSDFKDSTAGVS
jgi:hypothetical protein